MPDKTEELLDGRRSTYGDRVVNMNAMADMTNAYMDAVEQRNGGSRELTGADFAAIMVLYKVFRFGAAPDYADNLADVFGYAKIAEECVGEQMIQAGSAQEYQDKKEARKRGYPGVTWDEAKEVIAKGAVRTRHNTIGHVSISKERLPMPAINLDEQADVPSAIIPTERQQKMRDAELAGKKAAAARKGLQYTESEPGAQE